MSLITDSVVMRVGGVTRPLDSPLLVMAGSHRYRQQTVITMATKRHRAVKQQTIVVHRPINYQQVN